MTYPFTPEQIALLKLAECTWHRKAASKLYGLTYGEETVTETFLLDLALTYPGKVLITPFNKRQEAVVGADWAWGFASSDLAYITPMLVQAKALDDEDYEYRELHRFIGSTSERQIDRLISTARAWGWPAIYAFYNHLSDATRVPNNCKSLSLASIHQAPSWGITVADAQTVRSLIGDRTFDGHSPHSLPLHCLLCSGGMGVRPPGGSAELVLRGLRRLRPYGGGDSLPERPFDKLPPIFEDSLMVSLADDAIDKSRLSSEMRERYPEVGGTVIFVDDKNSA